MRIIMCIILFYVTKGNLSKILHEYTPHKSIDNIFVEMNENNNASFY